MMSHAAVTSASAPPRRGTSTRPGGARLPAALLLLAVPLVVAAWGLGGYSAQRERNNADTRLIDSLNSAGGVYRDVLSNVDSAATSLSDKRRVQHELFHGGHRAVVWRMRVNKRHPNGRVRPWRGPIPAAATLRIESGAPGGRAGDIRAGGTGYRTVSEGLGYGANRTRLAALEPSSYIDSRASLARWRVIGLGLAIIVALLAMAYAVSP